MSHTVYRSPYHATVTLLPSMSRPAQPNYALRRLLAAIAAAALLVVALFVLVLLAGLGGRPASASRAEPAPLATSAVTTVVAEPGDSLWSIATEHRGTIDLDRYVDTLIDLNGGTEIEVGQAVALP